MVTVSQIMFVGVILCLITVAISGCIDKEGEGIDENLTQSLTPFQTDSTVPPAPKQLFLHPNSIETFQFWGHNMTISYLAISPHLVELTIDGDTETYRDKPQHQMLGKSLRLLCHEK